MTAWRSLIVVAMLSLFGGRIEAKAKELPPPDYAAIRAAAQATEPGKDYVDLLPERLTACDELARSYNMSGTTSAMIESKYIMEECLKGMIVKVAELHFDPDAYGPCGIEAFLDKFAEAFYIDYGAAMMVEAECGEEPPCGSMYAVLPHDPYIKFLSDTVEMLVLKIKGNIVTPETQRWRDAMIVLRIPGDFVTPEWRRWRDAWRTAY
jgi:hypothetical protein